MPSRGRGRGVLGRPSDRCVVIWHPRYPEPLLLCTNLPVGGADLLALYRDRWPVEQLPLAAKQMLGAARQFVFRPESCHACRSWRLWRAPLSRLWRRPRRRLRRVSGIVVLGRRQRLRRALARMPFSEFVPLGGARSQKRHPPPTCPRASSGIGGKSGWRMAPMFNQLPESRGKAPISIAAPNHGC